ncbi:GNAT family N-acetyltransferase [Paenibacillus thermotolerans]|uniref:GNAT family N-acetyltransferase n=1 Tax=Paenibacillus thermotolerans TaxID=3027807 RepID=UPI002368EDCB|nr:MULTISPECIES: GNAT family N-acetyltransferase [unclassified Paenibacillus]
MIATQATVHELEEAAHLFDQYRQFYGQSPDLDGARAFLLERLSALQSVIFLARDDRQRAVGFMQLYPAFSSISMKRDWILNDLYVVEEARGQGAAGALLTEAVRYAGATGAKGIGLVTAADNVRAQRIYEAFGFEKDEHFFSYYRKG